MGLTIRTCRYCGEDRETRSARSNFFCSASACQAAAYHPTNRNAGVSRKVKTASFWRRKALAQARKIKRGESPYFEKGEGGC